MITIVHTYFKNLKIRPTVAPLHLIVQELFFPASEHSTSAVLPGAFSVPHFAMLKSLFVLIT